jgi:hypothetical protein
MNTIRKKERKKERKKKRARIKEISEVFFFLSFQ